MIASLRRRAASDDAGFSLIEVMAALVVIALVAGAGVSFFVTSIRGISSQKQHQVAVQLANQQIEQAEAVPPGQLASGRTQTAVQTQFGTAAATRLGLATEDDETNTDNWDTNSSDPLLLPTTATTATVNNLGYSLMTFVGVCWEDVTAGTCGPTKSSTTVEEFRVSVDVFWTSATPCAAGCDYNTSTLIDPSQDPTFNTNLSTPTLTSLTPGSVNNDNSEDSCSSGGKAYSGDLIKLQASGLRSGVTVRIAAAGGSVVSGSVYMPNASEVDFCLLSSDNPGAYTLSVINPDGGHFQTSITETPWINWPLSFSGGTLTLTGGGYESGATLVTTGHTYPLTVTTGYPGATDTATVSSFTPPTNGATMTLTLTNPDGSTAPTYITAPTVVATGLAAIAGQTVTTTLNGTGFLSGMTLTGVTGSCNPSVNYTTGWKITFNAPAGATGSCTMALINPDGGTSSTFTVPIDNPPTIVSIVPGTLIRGRSSTWTINVTNVVAGATVSVTEYGWPLSLSNLSVTSTKITFTTSPYSFWSGSVPFVVTVTNPDGTSASQTKTATVS